MELHLLVHVCLSCTQINLTETPIIIREHAWRLFSMLKFLQFHISSISCVPCLGFNNLLPILALQNFFVSGKIKNIAKEKCFCLQIKFCCGKGSFITNRESLAEGRYQVLSNVADPLQGCCLTKISRSPQGQQPRSKEPNM